MGEKNAAKGGDATRKVHLHAPTSEALLLSGHERIELLLEPKDAKNPLEGLSDEQWERLFIQETGLLTHRHLAELSRECGCNIAEASISAWHKNPSIMTADSVRKVVRTIESARELRNANPKDPRRRYTTMPIETALNEAERARLFGVPSAEELRALRIGALRDALDALTEAEAEELTRATLDVLKRSRRAHLLGNRAETERYLKSATVLDICDPGRGEAAGSGLAGQRYEKIGAEISLN